MSASDANRLALEAMTLRVTLTPATRRANGARPARRISRATSMTGNDSKTVRYASDNPANRGFRPNLLTHLPTGPLVHRKPSRPARSKAAELGSGTAVPPPPPPCPGTMGAKVKPAESVIVKFCVVHAGLQVVKVKAVRSSEPAKPSADALLRPAAPEENTFATMLQSTLTVSSPGRSSIPKVCVTGQGPGKHPEP